MPLDVAERLADERREHLRQVSREEQRQQQPLEAKESSRVSEKIDQFSQTGASFYSPYTDTLSFLRRQNPLIKSASYN